MRSSIILSQHSAHAGANRRRRAESAAIRLTDQPDVRPSLRTEAYESTTRTDDLLDLLVRSGAPLRQPLRAASVEPYAQQRIADECWTIVNRGGGRTTENECETEIENSVSASSSASIPPFLHRSDDEMIAGGAHVPLKAMPMGSTFGAEQLFGTSLGRDKVASFIDGDDEAYSDVYCLTPAGYRPLKSIVVYRMMALTVALMLLVLGVCAASSHIQDGYHVRNGIHREKLMSSLRSESEYALQRRNALRATHGSDPDAAKEVDNDVGVDSDCLVPSPSGLGYVYDPRCCGTRYHSSGECDSCECGRKECCHHETVV